MSELSSEGSGLRLSFLEIFNPDIAYSYVEIPLIQRDYAQGRASVGAVRERFLRSLKEALVGQSGELSLDFVYGEVVERQNGEQRVGTCRWPATAHDLVSTSLVSRLCCRPEGAGGLPAKDEEQEGGAEVPILS